MGCPASRPDISVTRPSKIPALNGGLDLGVPAVGQLEELDGEVTVAHDDLVCRLGPPHGWASFAAAHLLLRGGTVQAGGGGRPHPNPLPEGEGNRQGAHKGSIACWVIMWYLYVYEGYTDNHGRQATEAAGQLPGSARTRGVRQYSGTLSPITSPRERQRRSLDPCLQHTVPALLPTSWRAGRMKKHGRTRPPTAGRDMALPLRCAGQAPAGCHSVARRTAAAAAHRNGGPDHNELPRLSD